MRGDLARGGDTTHCEVTAQNQSAVDAHATITVSGADRHRLRVKNVTPPAVQTPDGHVLAP